MLFHFLDFINGYITQLGHAFGVTSFFGETRLTPDIEQQYNTPQYNMYTNCSTRQSGGVNLYLKRSYVSLKRTDMTIR